MLTKIHGGSECNCVHNLKRPLPSVDPPCDKECEDDTSRICEGTNTLSIYKAGRINDKKTKTASFI